MRSCYAPGCRFERGRKQFELRPATTCLLGKGDPKVNLIVAFVIIFVNISIIFVITIMICLSEEANSWSLTRRPPPLTGTQTSTLGNWWSININIFISIWHLPMPTTVQWPTALFQLRDEFSECSMLTIAHRLVGTTFYLSCFSYCWSSFWWREWSSQLHTVCLGITSRPQSGFKFN